jgi:hypothetical protein
LRGSITASKDTFVPSVNGLERRNVEEHIRTAVIGLDEAIAAALVEELHYTGGHRSSFDLVRSLRGIFVGPGMLRDDGHQSGGGRSADGALELRTYACAECGHSQTYTVDSGNS